MNFAKEKKYFRVGRPFSAINFKASILKTLVIDILHIVWPTDMNGDKNDSSLFTVWIVWKRLLKAYMYVYYLLLVETADLNRVFQLWILRSGIALLLHQY